MFHAIEAIMAQETYVVKYIFQGTPPLSAQHLTRRSGPFFACWGIFRTRALSVVDLVGAFAAKFGISRTRRRSCYGGGSPFRKCLLIGLPGRALVAIGAVRSEERRVGKEGRAVVRDLAAGRCVTCRFI